MAKKKAPPKKPTAKKDNKLHIDYEYIKKQEQKYVDFFTVKETQASKNIREIRESIIEKQEQELLNLKRELECVSSTDSKNLIEIKYLLKRLLAK